MFKILLECCLLTLSFARLRVDNPVNHVLRELEQAKREIGLFNETKERTATTYFYQDATYDHFGGSIVSEKKWSCSPRRCGQRYHVDSRFWGGDGFPVFLYIGGEGPQGPPSSDLLMWTLAEEQGALMISLEHRFYGESMPGEDLSDANLRVLTSEQGLADAAQFISYISAQRPKVPDALSNPPLDLPYSPYASKWVAFGGSYPGALTVWLKVKYPALLAGAVGSSAPVYANYNFFEYAEVTGRAFGYPLIGGSDQCGTRIAEAVTLIHKMAVTGRASELPGGLAPCGSVENDLDLSAWEQELFGNFQGAVQYNLEGRGATVGDLCEAIVSAKSSLQGFADATALLVVQRCTPSSWDRDVIAPLTDTKFSSFNSGRQWIYQSCNEFGYFQSANAGKHVFTGFQGVNITTAGALICEQAFNITGYKGPRANSRGLNANTDYGGRGVQGENILMPNGNMDPWHSLSVVNKSDPFYQTDVPRVQSSEDPPHIPFGAEQRISAGVEYALLDGTAHCRDMYSPGAFDVVGIKDTASVKWAHAKVRKAVDRFLH